MGAATNDSQRERIGLLVDQVDALRAGFEAAGDSTALFGLKITSNFVGIREIVLVDAEFNETTREGEVKMRFLGELNFTVRNAAGEIVEGNPNTIKSQRDIWTFARRMGVDDPNWQLVATDE